MPPLIQETPALGKKNLFARMSDNRADLLARLAALPPDAPPPVAPVEAFALADEARQTKLPVAAQRRYEALYKKGWRTIYRWLTTGEKKGEPCPLHDPAKMPGWWSRNMKWSVPSEIAQAALDAARAGPPAPSPLQIPTPDPAMPAASAARGDASSPRPSTTPAAGGVVKSIRLEDFDPEEGDRLRELKQLQVAKFNELRDALADGRDATILEGKYVKFCETLDKIESRVIERMKKRRLYVLREEVERDLAGNAELLRQTREPMPRRVLEQCPSLNADQRREVSAAIVRARAKEDAILCKLDCLKTDDLLRELAA